MKRFRLILFSILIFSGVFVIYVNYNQHEVTDARWVLPTAQSLAKEQNFTLNEYQPLILQNNHYGIDSAKGNAYSFYPIGTSLFAAPFIWLANNYLHESPASSVGHKISTGNDDPVSLQLAALIAALASLFIFLAAYQKTKKIGIAVLAAVLFAFVHFVLLPHCQTLYVLALRVSISGSKDPLPRLHYLVRPQRE